MDSKNCEGDLLSGPFSGQEAEVTHRSVAITEQRNPESNSSDESEAPIGRSEENVELIYVDPLHLE